MKIGDLRTWIEEVEMMGELKKVEGADWKEEIGCITQLNNTKNPPALLFDYIKDYPGGYRLLCSALRTPSRVALTFGLPITDSDLKLLEDMRCGIPKWETKSRDFDPQIVGDGPVLENIHSGKDINLYEFPTPLWHELDGGRYIGTGDAVITQDPDSGEVNLGAYRIMIHDEKTVALAIGPGHHGRIHCEKYHEQRKACPVAISLGHHPLIFAVAASRLSVPEYPFAGAIAGSPIKVIREEITGLPIPAESEVVIVGWCLPGRTRAEGPFGEWTGYYGTQGEVAPVVEIERIYHRKEPILLGCPPSRPPDDTSYYSFLVSSAILYNELAQSGVSDIKGVWLHQAGGRAFVVISIKQRYCGHARQAALIASQSQSVANMNKYVIVVDDDIDPTNTNDVIWALSFRSDPEKGIDITRQGWSTRMDPLIRRPSRAFFNSRAIIDACKPYEWIEEFPREVKPDPEVVERVRKKWGSVLGLSRTN